MRIRTHTFVTLDGYVSTPDGRPVQLLLPGFPGATAYGLPEFLASCEAVLMGRTTFLPALEATDWPWTQPVFVLTTRSLPEGTPDHVTTAPTAAAPHQPPSRALRRASSSVAHAVMRALRARCAAR